jgi:effector-binding domain-containing protein
MADSMTYEPEIVDLPAATTAVIGAVVPVEQLPALFDGSFPRLAEVTATQGVAIAGAAFALYHREPGETVDLEIGFVTDRPVQPDGDVRPGELPGGRVARLVHQGAYDELGSSWERLRSWIQERGLAPTGGFWEVYLTEPSPDMDPSDLRTELNWPVTG